MKLATSSFYYKPKSQSPERMEAEADLRDKVEKKDLEKVKEIIKNSLIVKKSI